MEGITRTRPGFELVAEALEGVVVMRMAGELDLAAAPLMREAVAWIEARAGEFPLVVDLARVSFIDSTGCRLLMEASDAAGGPVALLPPSDAVARVLELTGLRGRFADVPDIRAATLRALSTPEG